MTPPGPARCSSRPTRPRPAGRRHRRPARRHRAAGLPAARQGRLPGRHRRWSRAATTPASSGPARPSSPEHFGAWGIRSTRGGTSVGRWPRKRRTAWPGGWKRSASPSRSHGGPRRSSPRWRPRSSRVLMEETGVLLDGVAAREFDGRVYTAIVPLGGRARTAPLAGAGHAAGLRPELRRRLAAAHAADVADWSGHTVEEWKSGAETDLLERGHGFLAGDLAALSARQVAARLEEQLRFVEESFIWRARLHAAGVDAIGRLGLELSTRPRLAGARAHGPLHRPLRHGDGPRRRACSPSSTSCVPEGAMPALEARGDAGRPGRHLPRGGRRTAGVPGPVGTTGRALRGGGTDGGRSTGVVAAPAQGGRPRRRRAGGRSRPPRGDPHCAPKRGSSPRSATARSPGAVWPAPRRSSRCGRATGPSPSGYPSRACGGSGSTSACASAFTGPRTCSTSPSTRCSRSSATRTTSLTKAPTPLVASSPWPDARSGNGWPRRTPRRWSVTTAVMTGSAWSRPTCGGSPGPPPSTSPRSSGTPSRLPPPLAAPPVTEGELRGPGVSPGVYEGTARIVLDEDDFELARAGRRHGLPDHLTGVVGGLPVAGSPGLRRRWRDEPRRRHRPRVRHPRGRGHRHGHDDDRRRQPRPGGRTIGPGDPARRTAPPGRPCVSPRRWRAGLRSGCGRSPGRRWRPC